MTHSQKTRAPIPATPPARPSAPESIPDAAPASGAQPSRPHPLRVLVVEDDTSSQILARTFLEKAGFQVSLAANGPDALARAGAEAVDLVLMDVQLPGMDGVEAMARLRDQDRARGRRTPIIAFTAHTPGDDQAVQRADFDAILTKPLIRNIFLETIRRVLGTKSA